MKDGSVSTLRDFVWSYTERRPGISYSGNPAWQAKQHLLSLTTRSGVSGTLPDGPIDDNDHAGVDWFGSAYDGIQAPITTYRYVFSTDNTQEVRTTNKMVFDNAHRLNSLAFDYALSGAGVNNTTTPLLATMEYTIKDQLRRKNIGVTATGNFLQNIDYTYNVRGWLTNINTLQVYSSAFAILSATSTGVTAPLIQNLAVVPFLANAAHDKAFLDKAATLAPVVADVNQDLFNESIYYSGADTRLNATSQYNGNIQASVWQVANRNPQAYGYTYDELDRVSNGYNFDLQTTTGVTAGSTHTEFIENNKFNEFTYYDKRGNITGLFRNGMRLPDMNNSTNQVAGTYGTIDQLSYTYNDQNQVTKIVDAGDAVAFTKGFKYANSGLAIDYTYDANGNLISDKNKGITSFVYNFLNLPQTITFFEQQCHTVCV